MTIVTPILAVAGVAFDAEGRILLIRRGRAPARDLWTLPGGRLERRETPGAGLRREMREETGLEVEVGPLVEVVEVVGEGFHYRILDYLVRVRGGELRAGDDAAEARWICDTDVGALPRTEGLEPVIAAAAHPPRKLG